MPGELLSQQALRDDVAQIARLLGESHPDAYSAFGGPIAFHREVARILTAIPAEGLSQRQLFVLLRPLVAALRDGHTGLDAPAEPPDAPASRERFWLAWDAIDEQLYLSTVYLAEQRELLGARLAAVEDVPFAELARRMGNVRGYDNVYNNLVHLATALTDPVTLAELLERNEPLSHARVSLLLPDGASHLMDVTPSATTPGDPIMPATSVMLPEVNAADIGWGFLDPQQTIACLRIDALMQYREAFESWQKMGVIHNLGDHLARVARQAAPGDEAESIEARIAAIPSATEILRDLFMAMRRSGTTTLLVDLRKSTGGNSLLAYTLEYFLYGREGMLTTDDGYQISRYSPLYFMNYQSASDNPSEEMRQAMLSGGYDFAAETAWRTRQQSGQTYDEDARRADLADALSHMPTFARLLDQPEIASAPLDSLQVAVVTAAQTYSAGFDIASMLVKHGALLVGTPSAQSGNCFIDTLRFTLNNSKLQGTISFKRSLSFPNDTEAGIMLRPVVKLTYGELARMRFDPNAAVRLALEHLSHT